MALLSLEQRKQIFKVLGYGEYNEESIKKLQGDYLRSADVDGKYGTNTDNLVRHLYNVKKYCKNFTPQEFKCECGGRYCCGYPTYMKAAELATVQAIRDHYGKPMTITCGMRCTGYNRTLVGSDPQSLHLEGQAIDYYISGVTDTLANRKASIEWIKGLKYHRFTYGNGINSYGGHPNTPNMGNALHTDAYDVPVDGDGGYDYTLDEDGAWGNKTTITTQHILGCKEDGNLGEDTIKAIQKKVGADADGIWGTDTTEAMQKFLGVEVDGVKGKNTITAWQKWCNKQLEPTPGPTPEPEKKKYDGELPNLDIKYTKTYGQIIGETADDLAYATNTSDADYPSGSPTKAYKKALDSAYPNHSSWGAGAREGASCDVFVGTVLRYCGIDKSFPRGGKEQKPWLNSHSMYVRTKVSKVADLRNGDILWYSNDKHICLYYDGKIKEAGYKHYYAKTTQTASARLKSCGYYVYRVKGEKSGTRHYLMLNDKGDEVVKLQNFLLWYGCDLGKWGADGQLGAKSKEAIGKFQKENGLDVDYLWGTKCNAKAKEIEK